MWIIIIVHTYYQCGLISSQNFRHWTAEVHSD